MLTAHQLWLEGWNQCYAMRTAHSNMRTSFGCKGRTNDGDGIHDHMHLGKSRQALLLLHALLVTPLPESLLHIDVVVVVVVVVLIRCWTRCSNELSYELEEMMRLYEVVFASSCAPLKCTHGPDLLHSIINELLI